MTLSFTNRIDFSKNILDIKPWLEFAEKNKIIYNDARPFPHIVIDNFFPDEILDNVLNEFPSINTMIQKNKTPTTHVKGSSSIEQLWGAQTINTMRILNSQNFLAGLQILTDIPGLITDPNYFGGGLHQIGRDGFLSIHADFNFASGIHRRINLLLYLNHNWKSSYNGFLELWDNNLKEGIEIKPIFNRCVIFNTTSDSFHGHPLPLKCPKDVTRKSIALYYYSATRPANEIRESHNTIYVERPEKK